MLKGIEGAAREAGYDLLVHSTDGHARRALGEHNTDGLLVFTNSLNDRELEHLHRINFPTVLLHRFPAPGLNVPVITIENKSGAAMLVEFVNEVHGRRRIVFLRGPEGHEDSGWRERGYREALEAHGIVSDPALVSTGGFDGSYAFGTVQQMLSDGIDFDAIFAGDDDAAIGAIGPQKWRTPRSYRCGCGRFRRCSLRPIHFPAADDRLRTD